LRGVEYWPGDAERPPQIVFGSSDGKLYSLNAKTGKLNEAFGENGVVNLNTPEISARSARERRTEVATGGL
jgi:quinoprotein glucose dehydrogenase